MYNDTIFKRVLDASVYLSRLESIELTILKLLRGRPLEENPNLLVNQFIEILEFSDMPLSKIELAGVLFKNIVEGSMDLQEEDTQSLLDIIHECKYRLESFVEHHTHSDFVSSTVPTERYERYFRDLMDFLGYGEEDENLMEIISEIIYKYPGNYITSIYKYVTKNIAKVSYTTIWRYINDLEAFGKILTIGGPQGNLRYCFPNPKRIRNREEYYGKYFGIQGIVNEKITNHFTTTYKGNKIYDFYIVNSNVVPEVILAVGYGSRITPGSNVEIKAYGLIHSIKYLIESEGYVPETDLSNLDVLFGWRVTLAEDERKGVLWADIYNEELKQTLNI